MQPEEISKMSIQDRIQTMEQLWDSLLREQESPPPPDWHENVLAERRRRIESGEAKFLSLDDLKKLKSA